jgi:cysteine desulfuration protein SufE
MAGVGGVSILTANFALILARNPTVFPIQVNLAEKQQSLCEEFACIDDGHERLAAVVARTHRLPPLGPSERIDANRVRGCVSAVWLVGEVTGGRCFFRCDADGPLVKGLVALLCDFFSGFSPAELAVTDADPLQALDLIKDLSPTRRNGLVSTRAAIKAFAQNQLGAAGVQRR